MSTTFGPAVPIDGPPPQPRKFNLLTVSRELGSDERAAPGAHIEGYPPEPPYGFDPCETGTLREKELGSVIPIPFFAGFTAYVPITCSRFGMAADAEFRRRATVALQARDSHILEQQLVSGTVMPLNPHLGSASGTPALDIIDGTGVSARRAVALLEEAIGATAQQGVIHLTPGVTTQLGYDGLRVVGDRLETTAGTPVSSGSGYIDQRPGGQAALGPTEQWAWASGPIIHWRGEAYTVPSDAASATNHANNVATYMAERELLVGWDTQLRAAVLVDSAA